MLCLLAWTLHTDVWQPRRVRKRPLGLTFQLNNYKLKKITPTFYTHYKVIRGRTPWTCNYVTEMLIWFAILSCCVNYILTIIKCTPWHVDISTGRPVTWSYQILTTNRVMDSVYKSHSVSHLPTRQPWYLPNTGKCPAQALSAPIYSGSESRYLS